MGYAMTALIMWALCVMWGKLCAYLPCPKRTVEVHISYNAEHDFYMVYQWNHENRCINQHGMLEVNLLPELIKLQGENMPLVGRNKRASDLIKHAFMLHLKQRSELNDLKRDGSIHDA